MNLSVRNLPPPALPAKACQAGRTAASSRDCGSRMIPVSVETPCLHKKNTGFHHKNNDTISFFSVNPIIIYYIATNTDANCDTHTIDSSNRKSQADVRIKIAAGICLVWLVESKTRMVHVYRSPQRVDVLWTEDNLVGGDMFPGSVCSVWRLFPSDSQP